MKSDELQEFSLNWDELIYRWVTLKQAHEGKKVIRISPVVFRRSQFSVG